MKGKLRLISNANVKPEMHALPTHFDGIKMYIEGGDAEKGVADALRATYESAVALRMASFIPQCTETMWVVTTKDGEFGASAILYVNYLGIPNGDYFAIPSSVHGWVLLPDNGNYKIETVNEIINQVNDEQVPPEERLGDHAYRIKVG